MIRNFVIDRVRRGTMFHKTEGYALWSLNQITNPSLKVTADTQEAKDALDTPIAIFDRAKQAEFSAENALLDMGLMAAQSGSELEEATSTATFHVPYYDEVKVTTAGTLVLAKTPVAGTVSYVYALNGDESLGDRYEVKATGTTQAAGIAVLGTSNGKTTLLMDPTVAPVGARFMVFYEINANGDNGYQATRVTNSAKQFPTGGRFVMEVLGCDPCDTSTTLAAIIELPNAKLTSEFDLNFETDSTHSFTIKAMQDYCDAEKMLYRIYLLD